jgi:hypothetical protein
VLRIRVYAARASGGLSFTKRGAREPTLFQLAALALESVAVVALVSSGEVIRRRRGFSIYDLGRLQPGKAYLPSTADFNTVGYVGRSRPFERFHESVDADTLLEFDAASAHHV